MSICRFIGEQGEQIATDYLLTLGYHIVERNWRTSPLEIDIIAQKGAKLYFVEVKTRSCPDGSILDFMPEKSMTALKTERTLRAIEQYMSDHNLDCEVAMELIAINVAPTNHTLRHYHDVQIK